MSNYLATKAVRHGANFLDRTAPDWESRIDLDTLNLSLGNSCICGQVFKTASEQAGYTNGYHYIFTVGNFSGIVVRYLGFDCSAFVGYDSLKRAWKKEILRRRKVKRSQINANLSIKSIEEMPKVKTSA